MDNCIVCGTRLDEKNECGECSKAEQASSSTAGCSKAKKVAVNLDQEIINLLYFESLHSAESSDPKDAEIFSDAAEQLQPYIRL